MSSLSGMSVKTRRFAASHLIQGSHFVPTGEKSQNFIQLPDKMFVSKNATFALEVVYLIFFWSSEMDQKLTLLELMIYFFLK